MAKYKIASVSELAEAVADDPDLADNIQKDPAGSLRQIASALQNDRWVYRLVVVALGGTLFLAVGGALTLSILQMDIPDVLVALGSGALGALAGLLAPSPSR